ncbi:MAG TPA: helical backbone metal receptor [Candidatus Saccharimonadales bacterium]|nr:helical backbone metal receptor [Candidatus Saccharimonadales bacterium]
MDRRTTSRILRPGAILAALAALALAAQATASEAVTDGAGRRVAVPAAPARIVSMAPAVTEMLYALGLGSRVVGVSDFCRIPSGSPAPERIVSLKPDLAIATTSGNYLEDADRITSLGIPVYTVDTPTVDAVISTLEDLGRLLGAPDRATSLAGDLRRRLEAVKARVAGRRRVRVLFVVWGDPLLVPGRGTFINDALALAGADSVSSKATARWAEYGIEQVVAEAPEVILTVPDNAAFARALPSDPRWRSVPAVASGRIHVVGNEIQQPGPGIVDGIEEVAALLHPDTPAPAGD